MPARIMIAPAMTFASRSATAVGHDTIDITDGKSIRITPVASAFGRSEPPIAGSSHPALRPSDIDAWLGL